MAFPFALEEFYGKAELQHGALERNIQVCDLEREDVPASTRLVCMAYEELYWPIAERGREWQPDMVAPSTQTCILDGLTWTYCLLDPLSLIFAPEGEGPLRRSRGYGGLVRRLEAEMRELQEELRTPRLGGPEVRLALPTFPGSLFTSS
ncbi:hypothetical protein F5Y12DRAFT_716328 [Xylaria sp. FL1777]|nr:hypothetical protein F5Y12DRAFT_716328 [Xylaria sp. FL1777]